jgi:2-hydroxy-3-keto-5-methylthiopentenyl-1-phosphate phosphatase
MKEKLKKIQTKIESDPKLKEAVERIKPQKNIWGILGIITFFFLPELITYIWKDELIAWAHAHSITEALEMQRWLYKQLEEMFASGVSYLNLTLGALLLFWVVRSK